MYIRIIFGEDGHNVLYECTKMTINKHLKSNDEAKLLIDIQGETSCETVEIDKAHDSIFVMNNEGKTIESHRWNK